MSAASRCRRLQDVKSEVASAKSQGKKSVLMRIQTADGDRFVAVPFPKA